jgi:hypothetical protein
MSRVSLLALARRAVVLIFAVSVSVAAQTVSAISLL